MSLWLVALLVSTLVALAAVMAAIVRGHRTYRGYEDVMWQVRRLEAFLGGTAVREGRDVVITGKFRKLGAVVRVSVAEDTPEINIRLQAVSGFTLYVTPKRDAVRRGRHHICIGDRVLDSCYVVRTDDPFYADQLLDTDAVKEVRRLCSTPLTYVAVHEGVVELSELVRPAVPIAEHVKNSLGHMAQLQEALARMPGMEPIQAWPFHRSWAFRGVLLASVVMAGLATLTLARSAKAPAAFANAVVHAGIPQAHATRISNLGDWRLAEAGDFHGEAVSWLDSAGAPPTGTIPADFSGEQAMLDTVYVLRHRRTGEWRLVVYLGTQKRFDATFPVLAAVARIPKARMSEVEWTRNPGGHDGLLIVRNLDDAGAATVLFCADGRMVSAVPRDYKAISLRP